VDRDTTLGFVNACPCLFAVASSAGATTAEGRMVYRKGELSKSLVDRGWPHQRRWRIAASATP